MTTSTWITSLPDSGIETDLAAMTANGGAFSYTDAVTLLRDVEARGTVTAAEFASLQSIAFNLEVQNGITSSSYVASLFYQLVEGSQANLSWHGDNSGASSSTLGNLGIGTTTTEMSELIAKWFLGTDLPDPTASGDGTSRTIHPTYSNFSASQLWGVSGSPQLSDVAQGYDGDCELCSGMIDVLENHPSQLEQMFVNDGNGVYGVRFYVNGKETWVTVNSELPTYEGTLLYNDQQLGTNDGLWASLIEKAYAELSADGNIGHPATNSYDNISADSAFDVLTNLLNTPSVQYLYSQSVDWNAYKNIVIEALQAGDDVIVETGPNDDDYTTNSQGQKLLVANHAFAVMGYDSATGDFILRNPWGTDPNDNSYVTEFEVSMASIASVGGDFVVDDSVATNVVFNIGQDIVGIESDINASFSLSKSYLGALSVIALSSLFHPIDTAGLSVTDYKLELLGTGGLNLNDAANLATTAQMAAGEVVVSAADLGKLTISTGSPGGEVDLFVSGNDGTGWSTPTELYWYTDSTQLTVLPSNSAIVAPSAAIAIASLFTMAGATATDYFIKIDTGGGTLNLNGAADLLDGTGSGGQIEVTASDLAKLTYTASATSGITVLDITAADGNGDTSDATQVPVAVGYSVAATLSAFDAGQTPYQVAVTDTAANIFANLDQLEQMMPNWDLLGIVLTDTSIPTETITAGQLLNDRGVLSLIDGTLVLDVIAPTTTMTIEGLPNLATVIVYSGTTSQYTLSEPGSGVVDVTSNGVLQAISGVVALQFADHELFVASETPTVAGAVSSAQITNLYAAVFARTPDVAGLSYYEQQAAANPALTIVNFAQSFLASPEYTAAHSYAQTTAGDTQFITDTYENLLHRAPDNAAAITYYLNAVSTFTSGLTAGTAAYSAAENLAHATILADFSQSPEFIADVQVTATHPADATHWLVLV